MLAKAALAAGLPFYELDFPQNCIALCASNLRSPPRHSRRRRQRLRDPLLRKPGAFSYRLSGTDGEGTANDFLEPSEGQHEKQKEIPVLWNLIQDIEPMDVSRVGQDISTESKDAMKRTISGMLGLLPSDRFDVAVKASRESSTKLLISSIMTGYTLRNAEYRVCLQRSLELAEAEDESKLHCGNAGFEIRTGKKSQGTGRFDEQIICDASQSLFEKMPVEADDKIDSLHTLSPEVGNYINQLKSKLSSLTKELQDCKINNSAKAMNKMVGEEKNDLLDYLRSLDTEKVSELSQPSSLEVEEMIRHVVSRCLQAMFAANFPMSTMDGELNLFEGAPEEDDTHCLSSITATRDYLARLLFWCMLFGHHLRSLEYRLELSRILSLC